VEGQESAKDYVPLNPDSNMSQALYRMLYRSLTTGAPLEITPQQVRRQIAVIEEAQAANVPAGFVSSIEDVEAILKSYGWR
jgi:hypothetical protein